jgi:hypothetical protein
MLYDFFAILVYKQVQILNKALQTKRAWLINSFALAHLLFGLLLLIVVILLIL